VTRPLPKQFPFLVFDWDGTLADSTADIVGALEASCVDLRIPVPADGGAREVIGLGVGEAIARVAPGLSAQDHSRFAERFRHHYLTADATIPLFAGVTEMLADLVERGFLLGVATGKSRRGLERSLAQYGIAERFAATRCADEGFAKPHPDMLLTLMERTGHSAEKTLMIGDTTHDLQLARNAGVAAVAVAYGAHRHGELSALSPLTIAHSVAELHVWLVDNG
jgi:phosphoglycolate phosphatase